MIVMRIEKRRARPARRELEVLSLDPRDPDIVRARQAEARSTRTNDRRASSA